MTELNHFVEVTAIASKGGKSAKGKAQEFSIPQVLTVEKLTSSEDVDWVLILTNPDTHYSLATQALNGGKHVYLEKPLSLQWAQVQELFKLAEQKGLYLGSAPDVILGGAFQTCLKLLRDNWIGVPVSVHGHIGMNEHGSWYHKSSVGGVLMDMAPYYLAAMIALFGPVRRVMSVGSTIRSKKRNLNSGSPEFGLEYTLDCQGTVKSLLEFQSGMVGDLTLSNDGYSYTPELVVHGTGGKLVCNDPNMFHGNPVLQFSYDDHHPMPLVYGFSRDFRGLGLVEMIRAIQLGRLPRLNRDFVFHWHEVLFAMKDSYEKDDWIHLRSTCASPEPMPLGTGYEVFF